MKFLLLVLIIFVLPASAPAQQQHKYPRAPAVVETYKDSNGVMRTRRRTTAVPERRTVTKWRYHKGYKRASEVRADSAKAAAR